MCRTSVHVAKHVGCAVCGAGCRRKGLPEELCVGQGAMLQRRVRLSVDQIAWGVLVVFGCVSTY